MKDFTKRFTDDGNLIFGQVIVERQGDGPLTDCLGDGKIPLLIAELLGDEWHEMHGREVVADLDTAVHHLLQNSVALLQGKVVGEPDAWS